MRWHYPGLYTVQEPQEGPGVPLFVDSPHSGRDYPADFGSRLSLTDLRAAEDSYMDRVAARAPLAGGVGLWAHFPRAYIDVNRTEADIDPALLAEPWPTPLAPGDKTAMGIGLIRRVTVPGKAIYDRALSVAEVERRIARFHRPYLSAVERGLATLVRHHGRAVHLNVHSMKSVGNAATPDGAVRRPDVVLGDRFGTSCAPALTALVGEVLAAAGLSVAVNDPYAGAALLARFGAPDQGRHGLQIELNRGLYMTEDTGDVTDGLTELIGVMDGVFETVSERLADPEWPM